MEQARPAKSPDAFRTISEAAAELDLPQHVLRFWESRFPQIKPMKRAGGRRYYRRNDIELLSNIKDLLHKEGYTIKGVQKMLRQNNGHFSDSANTASREPAQNSQNTGEASTPSTAPDNREDILTAIGELEAVRDTLRSTRKTS